MERQRMKRVATVAVAWAASALLALTFFRAGAAKFSDDSGWAHAFAVWGFPDWFRVLIGVLEVSAATLVLIPRVAPVGALLIIAVMLGGMGTHVAHGDPGQVRSEVVQLLLATILLIARRAALVDLLARVRRGSGVPDPHADRS
jgi:putative oxidoreductase